LNRDLKPENLVLQNPDINSNLKVIDFGTSTVFKKKGHMNELLGTVYGLKEIFSLIMWLQK